MMRKMRLKYAAAVAAIMVTLSCTSESVEYDEPGQIGFFPVAQPLTKLASGAMESEYSTLETFGVFAYYKDTGVSQSWEDFVAAPGEMQTWMSDAPFACIGESIWAGGIKTARIKYERDENATDYVKGSSYLVVAGESVNRKPQYWPKTGYLAFAGYSPYNLVSAQNGNYDAAFDDESGSKYIYTKVNASYSTGTAENGYVPCLTVTDFTQGDYCWVRDDHWATNETVDLMWFDADDQYTAGRETVSESTGSFPVGFKHACAWIDFSFASDEAANEKFVILKATLSNMYWTGTFVSDDGSGNPEWTDLKGLRDIILYDNIGDGDEDEKSKFNYVTETGFHIGNMLVIPQDTYGKTDGNGTSGLRTTLTIKYKKLTSDTEFDPDGINQTTLEGGGPITETFVYDFEDMQAWRWECGKHYTYNIRFTLGEPIIVMPDVDENWGNTESDNTVEP